MWVLVWNLKTRQSRWVRPIQNHAIQTTDTPFCQVEFSPNSRLLATSLPSPSNKLQSGVRIWNVLEGTLQQVIPMAVVPYINPNKPHFAFSPDSSVLGFVTLVKGYSQLHLWNLSARKLQAQLQARLQAVDVDNLVSIEDFVFSPNQQDVMALAFSFDGLKFSYIYRWQIKTGKLQQNWQKSRFTLDRTDSILALSPDSQTFVYGGEVGGYNISNFSTTYKRFPFPQALSPTSGSTRVVFSPDGQQMAIESNGQTINIIH
ncbi:hypothetical protein Cri9333_0295 [Crinalium epipsammum PCC 9333]|uniref:WD40 repeat-containing protein n=2 Tax=Crinalium TaxID=241421 RepID=K9VTK8_9CYAN|nr:hypothetical protein Cri9333_0295 [Crinalium epipsammum PCC 9333]